MKKACIILAAALAAFCACQPQPRLVILHTNDTHSHFEPLRGGKDDGHGGVIERAAFVDSVRNACGAGRDSRNQTSTPPASEGTVYRSDSKFTSGAK